MIRKCCICKLDIDTEFDDYAKKKTKALQFMHRECYIDDLLRKKKNMTREKAVEMSYELENEAKDWEYNKIIKDRLYEFIMDFYDIAVLDKSFFIKMNSIFDGTYKGLAKGIPPSDIYDMWHRQQANLLRLYEKNTKIKNKEFTNKGRANYDLAYLLNHYDDYLEWKRKEEAKNDTVKKETVKEHYEEAQKDRISTNIMNTISINANIKRNEDEDNIADILDEI